MADNAKIIIVGAGVIGLCVAESLLREDAGYEIVILDPAPFDESGASFGNGGIIVPSHFVPLADPGLLRSGLKMMLNPRSPFGLQKLPDLEMMGWIWRFMQSATKRKAAAAGPLLRDLNLASRAAYEDLIKRLGLGVGYAQKGLLMLCRTQQTLDGEAHLAESAQALGVGARVLDKAQVKAMEPQAECLGGVYFGDDAHLTPAAFMTGLREALVNRGVSFVTGTAARFEVSQGRVSSVIADDGRRLDGDRFVVANGAWISPLVRSLNLKLPMLSGKGYGITAPVTQPVAHPMILTEARVAVTPMVDGVRFVGTLELGPPSNTVNEVRVGGFLDSVGAYLPAYSRLERSDVWLGNRPCTPDGLPYLGAVPSFPNVVIAAGHAMMGLSLGPVTGDLVADILSGRAPRQDVASLSPGRFG